MAEPIRVVHVDDEPDFAAMTGVRVKKLDDTIEWAAMTDGEQALEFIDTTPDVDCIVCDYEMPGMDGITLFQAIKARRPYVPFILLTAKGDEDLASRSMGAGITDYLPKSSQEDHYRTLLERIHRAIERTEEYAELERRAHQQTAAAYFGETALGAETTTSLRREACALITSVLDCGFAEVLEYDADAHVLDPAGSVGFTDAAVEPRAVDVDADSYGSYVLASREPVIVTDVVAENRFIVDPALVENGVQSSLRAIIGPPDDPWGVLGAHATDPNWFDRDDARFVQLIGNTLAAAIGRERRENALARYHTIIRNLPLGFFRTSDEGVLLESNPAMQTMFGAASHDELTALDPYIHYAEPADRDTIRSALETSGLVIDTELPFRRLDGTTFWGALTIVQSRERDTTYYAGILDDITTRMEQHEVLDAYRRELERSNEELEQFAYVASHDLQEPLRMISSYVGIIADEYQDDLPEEAVEFMDFAVDGAQRMQAMIDALLRFSRVNTRGEPFEPTDSEALLESVLRDLELTTDEHDADITYEALPEVECDPIQLGQVFRNLIVNAILHAGDAPPEITITATADDDETVFTVSDTGPGIDPVERDTIFEIFTQGRCGGETGGTGIGLAIVKRIVERHGGRIWVDSEPGEGAAFSFTIPHDHPQTTMIIDD